ncbi:MAG: DUF1697 domain-containing protein [Solirubrobacterales bacterium]|nr:DUF1697 domain-containing protein [Solirubrobacterales bacterium]
MARNRTHILLLRGINLGARKRVPMPELRALLSAAGFEDVRTYVQSGNVVLSSGGADSAALGARCEELIAERLGFDVDVIVRTEAELADVVARNPLSDVAVDPKRYQVSFLETEPDPEVVARMAERATDDERLVAIGRELYAWHPAGVARSKLWAALAGKELGVRATARNWTTVTTLLEMARAS